MVIEKIEVQKNNKEKVNIYANGKYSFSMTMNGLLSSGLKEGMEVSEERIDELKTSDAPGLAFLKALDIISYSMKTEKELIRKLREKKFPDDAIEYAVNKMKSYHYIDDEAYVTAYINSRAIPNKWGDQKIISMLLSKGVDMQLIKDKITEIYSDDKKTETATEAAKKYAARLKNMEPRKARQKLYQHLASKGYQFDVISDVCNKVLNADEYED